MKIYTKTGDDGTTGLLGGSRVPKSDLRIDCYGTVDELNAALGLAATAIDVSDGALRDALWRVQNELFVIGSRLALPADTAPDSPRAAALPALESRSVARLESEIDAAEAQLPPLRNFILPGGTEAAARLHFARTVCRRAERLLVGLAAAQPVDGAALTYLNRLSDWLFVQARRANHSAGVADVPWMK